MNVLLLAPKHGRDGKPLDDLRSECADRLKAAGHRPVVLEDEPDRPDETLRQKFLRLAEECEQAVLVWPQGAAMATTADEILLLQEIHDRHPIRIVLLLHETEVDERDHELHIHFPADQSRYLDGILNCDPYILWWSTGKPFDGVLDQYFDAYL